MSEPATARPGVYRTWTGQHHIPPERLGFKRYKEWCKETRRKVDDGWYFRRETITKCLDDFLTSLDIRSAGAPNMSFFFDTPKEFFKAWLRGYSIDEESIKDCDGDLPGVILQPDAKGFKLWYTTWDENDPNFKVSYQKKWRDERTGEEFTTNEAWTGLDKMGRMSKGIVLVTDLNGIIDLDYMALAVNDLDTKRVYSYKPKEETSEKNQDIWAENTLLEGEDPYIFAEEIDEPEFPFESLNPQKTGEYTWCVIGFTPQEVYNALRGVGFRFPGDKIKES